jgi:transposase
MKQPTTRQSPAAVKERAVQLAVASEHPIAQTARDLEGNAKTLPTWIGQHPRVERQEQEDQGDHLEEKRKRWRKDHARLQEERDICKKAAASLAPQLPYSTRGCPSRTPRSI